MELSKLYDNGSGQLLNLYLQVVTTKLIVNAYCEKLALLPIAHIVCRLKLLTHLFSIVNYTQANILELKGERFSGYFHLVI